MRPRSITLGTLRHLPITLLIEVAWSCGKVMRGSIH